MITEDCGCRKKHLHFTADLKKTQMFFNFSCFIKKQKHLGEYPKIRVTCVTIVVDFFLSMSHSSLWYSSDEMHIYDEKNTSTSTENVLTWAKIYVVVQELYETRAKQECNRGKNPCEFLVRSLTGSGWDTHYQN